jgi:pimeloyl-ACP methyl ester carboxylesterase
MGKPEIIVQDVLAAFRRSGSHTNSRAVVFVHGFTGDSEQTWKHPETLASFPELVFSDSQLADYDVFTFGYKSGFWRPPAIDNIAKQFEAVVTQHLENYQLTLLAHSMGGIVCMRYILDRLSLGYSLPVTGLVLFGTPMSGVEWVRYAKQLLSIGGFKIPLLSYVSRFLSANKQLAEIENDSLFLQRLFSDWILRIVNGGYLNIDGRNRAWIPVRVVTGNDDWVVKESSAKGVYGSIDWMNVDRDHEALVKPRDRTDITYQHAATFLSQSRAGQPPDVLHKLREQVSWVWGHYKKKLIGDWQFELVFHEPGQPSLPQNEFGLQECYILEVRKCQYDTFLQTTGFEFGFALGQITSEAIWRDSFAYLHRVLLGGLDDAARSRISKLIRTKLENPGSAWRCLFRDVRLRVCGIGDEDWFDMLPATPQREGDGLVTNYTVPEQATHLIDQGVSLEISFTSWMPVAITDFRLVFPWLCHKFDAQMEVYGATKYFDALVSMTGRTEPDVLKEDLGSSRKLWIHSDELAMSGSGVQLEWSYSS